MGDVVRIDLSGFILYNLDKRVFYYLNFRQLESIYEYI